MFLKRINLTNFRNYSNLNFEFTTPVTVLLGDNAQGKSNFLEAIYFLSTTKSSKADIDLELIKNDQETLHLQGLLEDETTLEIAMQKGETGLLKRVKVNGVPRRVLDYIGHLSVVSFSPEDINLVTGSPSLRRWHLDLTLAQIDKDYKSALTNYEEIVTRKNRVLKMIKEGTAKVEELSFWSEKQLEFGTIVSQKRSEFFDFLNALERNFGAFQFAYARSVLNPQRLKDYQVKEIASSSSLIGPHRDDFIFCLDNRNLSKFGSRGERRTAVLDLKISEASFIEKSLGKRPLLLLDDVFSELDSAHKKHVLSQTLLQQTIIAAVELDPELEESLKEAATFFVENGQLNEKAGKSPKPPKE